MTELLGTRSSIQDVALVFQLPDLQNSVALRRMNAQFLTRPLRISSGFFPLLRHKTDLTGAVQVHYTNCHTGIFVFSISELMSDSGQALQIIFSLRLQYVRQFRPVVSFMLSLCAYWQICFRRWAFIDLLSLPLNNHRFSR